MGSVLNNADLVRRDTADLYEQDPNIPQHIGNTGDLIEFASPREDRQTQEEFDYDTAQRPHVDRC